MTAALRCLLCGLGLFAAVYLTTQPYKSTIVSLVSTKIATLLNRANEFDGRRVIVTGDVVPQGAAILGYGVFRLRQDDSDIWVLTNRGIPASGQTSVSGIFRQAVRIGDKQVAVVFQD